MNKFKKVLIIPAAIAMTSLLWGCGAAGPANYADLIVSSPITECKSLSEINALADTDITDPGIAGASDKVYRVIDDEEAVIAEYEFQVDGITYTMRAADSMDDISGVYISGKTAFSGAPTEDIKYLQSDNILLARWVKDDIQYVLISQADLENTPEAQAMFEAYAEDFSA